MWLAKKRSTGDVMAIKAMRKEHLRETHQIASINVEHAILGDLETAEPHQEFIRRRCGTVATQADRRSTAMSC